MDNRRLAGRLTGLAALLLVFYLSFGFIVPQTPGRLTRPGAGLIGELWLWRQAMSLDLPVPRSAGGVAALVVGLAGLAFTAYAAAVRLSWKRRSTAALAVALVGAIAFAAVSIAYLPNLNNDIFNYIARGRLAAVHGENPYYVAIDRFPNDPLYPHTSPEYRHTPGEKLPTWMLVNLGLAHFAGDDPARALLTYRAALALVHVASLFLLASLLGHMTPQFQLAGVIAFGWCPITALYAQSKTDTIMVFFLLAGLHCLVAGRRRLALIPLVLSGFVKLLTLPLAGIIVLERLSARRWRAALIDVALVAGTTAAIYWPFTNEPGLILRQLGLSDIVAATQGPPAAAGTGENSGPAQIGSAPVEDVRAGDVQANADDKPEQAVSRPAGVKSRFVPHLGPWSFFVWFLIVLGVGLAGETAWIPRMRRWTIVTLLCVLLFSKLEFSWYLMAPLALASLAASGALTGVVILVSFSSFLFTVWESTSTSTFRLPSMLDIPRATVHLGLAAIATFGALALAYTRRRPRRAR